MVDIEEDHMHLISVRLASAAGPSKIHLVACIPHAGDCLLHMDAVYGYKVESVSLVLDPSYGEPEAIVIVRA